MKQSASNIDKVGDMVESKIKKSDKISIKVEGNRFEGTVLGQSENNISDYRFSMELSGDNIIVVFTDVVQRTQPNMLDHYESEAYIIDNSEKYMHYVGLVTELKFLD